jgi:hypothetical protein
MEIPKLINHYSLGRASFKAIQIISIFFEALRAALARIARFFTS